MILTKEIKIKIPDNLTSDHIETELKKRGYNVLHWAIIDCRGNDYVLSISTEQNSEEQNF